MVTSEIKKMGIEEEKIGLGGGCHWCTEAVFEALNGVYMVEQGFIASTGEAGNFSEAVIVQFNPTEIPIEILIEIHLYTHGSTSNHKMRSRYRSAIYTFNEDQREKVRDILNELQAEFERKIVTGIYPFIEFKPSPQQFQNYYSRDPEKPFCKTYIHPKLNLLLREFSKYLKEPYNKG